MFTKMVKVIVHKIEQNNVGHCSGDGAGSGHCS